MDEIDISRVCPSAPAGERVLGSQDSAQKRRKPSPEAKPDDDDQNDAADAAPEDRHTLDRFA
jgi:hypothetical protein